MSNESLEESAKKAYKSRNYKKAYDDYSRLIENEPTPDFYEQRAMCQYHQNQLDGCLDDFNKAQQLQPNNPYRYSSRAFVKNRMGDVDGAIEDYQKAVHLDPEDAISFNNLGLVLEQKGYAKNAKQNFDKADSLLGVQPKTSTKEPQILVEKEEESVGVVWLIKKIFTEKSVRNQYFDFLKKGLKLK